MKAFALSNIKKAKYSLERKAQIEYVTAKLPTISVKSDTPPPDMIAVIGPRSSGKTTLVKSLVKQYSFKVINQPIGPITVTGSSQKRLQLFDTPSTLTAVLDIARVVDLIIVVINA